MYNAWSGRFRMKLSSSLPFLVWMETEPASAANRQGLLAFPLSCEPAGIWHFHAEWYVLEFFGDGKVAARVEYLGQLQYENLIHIKITSQLG